MLNVGKTASVGHVLGLGPGRVLPVLVLLDAAALELEADPDFRIIGTFSSQLTQPYLVLDHVPSVGDAVVAVPAVVEQAFFHVGVDDAADLGSHDVSGDADSELDEEDASEEEREGEGHALVLLDGSAAAEEGDTENDQSDNDLKENI